MAFNPYHKWLGIPPEEQPPNHYRLLSVPQFESDADVIEAAAERQTGFLRTFQTGPDSELAERLLNEVAAARVCLLDEKAKSNYDGQLKEKQSAAESPPIPKLPEISVAADRLARPKSVVQWPTTWTQAHWVAAGGGALVTLLVVIVAWVFGPDDTTPKGISNTQSQQQLDVVKKVGSPPRAAKSLPASLQQGLVAYYPFNGNAQDESGNGHHGVIYGARLATDRHVQQEKAFAFKHGQYIQLPPKLLSQQETLAMSAWCKPAFSNAKKWPRIVGGNGNALAKNISINIGQRVADQKKRLVFELETEAGNIVAESPEIPVGHWIHVAMVSDGQSLTCFLNGKRIAKKAVIGKLVTMKTLTVGDPDSSFHYEGAIDDVRIYNRALSEKEVRQLYEFESSGTAVATASDKLYLATLRPVSVGAYRFSSNGLGHRPGKLITVNGIPASSGIALHPRLDNKAGAEYNTPVPYQLLAGAVALEDYSNEQYPTLTFRISAEGKKLWESAEIRAPGQPVGFCVQLNGALEFKLITSCNNANGAHAVWLDPVLLKSTGGKSLAEIAKEQQARWLKKED